MFRLLLGPAVIISYASTATEVKHTKHSLYFLNRELQILNFSFYRLILWQTLGTKYVMTDCLYLWKLADDGQITLNPWLCAFGSESEWSVCGTYRSLLSWRVCDSSRMEVLVLLMPLPSGTSSMPLWKWMQEVLLKATGKPLLEGKYY